MHPHTTAKLGRGHWLKTNQARPGDIYKCADGLVMIFQSGEPPAGVLWFSPA